MVNQLMTAYNPGDQVHVSNCSWVSCLNTGTFFVSERFLVQCASCSCRGVTAIFCSPCHLPSRPQPDPATLVEAAHLSDLGELLLTHNVECRGELSVNEWKRTQGQEARRPAQAPRPLLWSCRLNGQLGLDNLRDLCWHRRGVCDVVE